MDRNVDETALQDQIEDLLRQADDCARAGDQQSARQIWEAVLQIDPQNPRAQEELQLASVLQQDWPWSEDPLAGQPLPAGKLAEIKELLDAGLIEQAHRGISDLTREHPGNLAVLALQEQVGLARERAPMVAQGVEEARAALAGGNRERAIAACRKVLGLEAGNREAEMILEQAELMDPPSSPASAPAPLSLDLELDLALARPQNPPAAQVRPPVPAPPPAPPAMTTGALKTIEIDPSLLRDLVGAAPLPSRQGEEPTTVRDLLEAADDLTAPPEDLPAATGPGWSSPESPLEGKAALLVARAWQALQQADLATASELASQALALAHDAPGAQEVLEEVRKAGARRVGEADTWLNEGAQLLDQGKAQEAAACFEKALAAVPGHPEAQELLARARGTSGPQDAHPAGHPAIGVAFEEDLSSLASIPVAGGVPPGLPSVPDLPDLGPAPGTNAALSGAGVVPALCGGRADQIPSAPPVPSLGGPGVPPMGSAPPTGSAPKAGTPAPPAGAAFKKPAAGFLGSLKEKVIGFALALIRRYLIRLAVLLVVTVAGLGLQLGGSWLGLWGEGDTAVSEAVAPAAARPKPKNPGVPAPATPGPAPAVPAPAKVPREEVPALLAKARTLLNQGDPQGAIDLLAKVQEADPLNFEAIDRLEQARLALKARQEEEGRLRTVRDSFNAGDYEEALRILYRLPKNQQPPHLERWQANGWYNLAVLRLQTGDLAEANEYFNECLQLTPNDQEARKGKELVRRYRGKTQDAAYRRIVDNLELRALDAR